MPSRQLGTTGMRTSALAFGCASLLGPRSRADALSLLDFAHGMGISHFDVARSYASGEAESVVGEFLARHDRSSVTIATKFGIEPLPTVAQRRLLRQAARQAMRLSPKIRQALGQRAARMVKRNVFGVDEARRSLEVSLRELRTEYIDVLLLHDATPADVTPELLEFLCGARDAGQIRAFGIGTNVSSATEFATRRVGDVLQFAHAVTQPGVSAVRAVAPVTHGALRGMGRIMEALRDPVVSQRWSAQLDRSVRPDVLPELMLEWAVATNPGGPVLVATTRSEHLEANARAAQRAASGPSLERLTLLIAGMHLP